MGSQAYILYMFVCANHEIILIKFNFNQVQMWQWQKSFHLRAMIGLDGAWRKMSSAKLHLTRDVGCGQGQLKPCMFCEE